MDPQDAWSAIERKMRRSESKAHTVSARCMLLKLVYMSGRMLGKFRDEAVQRLSKIDIDGSFDSRPKLCG